MARSVYCPRYQLVPAAAGTVDTTAVPVVVSRCLRSMREEKIYNIKNKLQTSLKAEQALCDIKTDVHPRHAAASTSACLVGA